MPEDKAKQLKFIGPEESGEDMLLVPEPPKKLTPKDFPPPSVDEQPIFDNEGKPIKLSKIPPKRPGGSMSTSPHRVRPYVVEDVFDSNKKEKAEREFARVNKTKTPPEIEEE